MTNIFASTIPAGIPERITFKGEDYKIEIVTNLHKVYHNAEEELTVCFCLDGELLAAGGMGEQYVIEALEEPETIVWASPNLQYALEEFQKEMLGYPENS